MAFSSLARFGYSLPACVFFFFFFKVEISSRTLIPLFTPGSVHSDSASRDDCGWVCPDELRVSSFPDRFSHYAWTAAWVKDVCWGNTGVERTPNESQHTKLTLKKKMISPLLPGIELATFQSWVRRSCQLAILAPECRLERWHLQSAEEADLVI